MAFSPGAWLAGCCVMGALLLRVRPRLGRLLVTIGAVGFAAVALLPLDQWALAPLEARFPKAPDQPMAGIIVLGGAIDAALSADRSMPALNNAAERMTELVRLARAHPDTRVIFTGGPSPNRPDGPTEAAAARLLMADLGLPDGRVGFESASRTTWENAVFTRAMVSPKPGETWLLVTSAAHMPRSVGAFRRAGWTVVADPVGYKTFLLAEDRGRRGFGERLALLDTAAHEWIGLVAYRFMDRSSAWFPAP
jgi:uncharacterized SAM-binding protein YcdF (DUF218 family)